MESTDAVGARPEAAANGGEIRAEAVGMAFDGAGEQVVALDGVSLAIEPGRFVSLLGPSGCGKSTLLKILGGLLQPTSGAITIGGRPAAEAVRRRQIGLVFQQPILLPWRNATRNAAFLRDLIDGRRGRDASMERAREMLELVGLGDAGDRLPSQLSGGMAQRVAIARALTLDPAILLMDEPFGALDAITRDRMNERLLDIWQRTGKTIVFVTHSITEALFLSDEVHVMATKPGRIRETLTVDLPRPRYPDQPGHAELERHLRELLVTRADDDPDEPA